MLKGISRIGRIIFGIYAALIFAITLIIASILYFLIFSLLSKKIAPFIAHKYISRNWAKTLFLFYGIILKVKNRSYLDKKQTYVFVANHRSLLDIPSYAISTQHAIRFLAKVELTKIPLMGYVIGKLYISVDRKDKAARARSMENMINSLNEKISVFICPEGTRNKTADPLLPFHDGAFRLAIQSQLPLAILVIKNSEKRLSPVDPISLSPGIISCEWSKPISTVGMTADDLPRLKQMTADVMTGVMQA